MLSCLKEVVKFDVLVVPEFGSLFDMRLEDKIGFSFCMNTTSEKVNLSDISEKPDAVARLGVGETLDIGNRVCSSTNTVFYVDFLTRVEFLTMNGLDNSGRKTPCPNYLDDGRVYLLNKDGRYLLRKYDADKGMYTIGGSSEDQVITLDDCVVIGQVTSLVLTIK